MDADQRAELGRMRWRCRRGTTELDRMLGWWLDARYSGASAVQRAAFDRLLDQQDPDLWDWLIDQGRASDDGMAAIVDDIRGNYRS